MCIKTGLSYYYSAVLFKSFNMANYQIVQGIRTNSKVFIHEEYRYTVAKSYDDYKRLRCVQYKNLCCLGAAVLKDSRITLIKKHNHETDDVEIMLMTVKESLKKAVCEREDKDIRTVYDNVMGTYPDNVKRIMPWKSVRSTLYAHRKKSATVVQQGGTVVNNAEGDRCKVCLMAADETWVFDPCGHYPFCGGCSCTIIGNGLTCPICRHAIEKRMRIYHS